MILNETQIDVFKELFNRGIGKSAEILSEMMGSPINLSVPDVGLHDPSEIQQSFQDEYIIGIKQVFTGSYKGEAMILYGQSSCLEVISALLGYEGIPTDFGHLEKETLSEFGNIILSSCLFEFEQALSFTLPTSSPAIISGRFPDDFVAKNRSSQIMTLTMDFSLSATVSKGNITLMLDPSDIKDIAPKLDAYLEELLAS